MSGTTLTRDGVPLGAIRWISAALVPSALPTTELFVLPPTRQSAGSARRSVTATLATWAIDDDVADDVRLIVSELVGNATVHGQGDVWVLLMVVPTVAGGVLRVDVFDEYPVTPALLRAVAGRGTATPDGATPDDSAECGRGLALVRELTDHRLVLVPAGQDGKAVRAELDLPAG